MAASLDSVLRYSELLDLYRNLLSDTQRDILEDYYSYNLSLSEIAENRHISKSAVEDAIKKGKRKLDNFEKELCSLEILNKIRSIKNESTNKELISKLEEIERIMKHGI